MSRDGAPKPGEFNMLEELKKAMTDTTREPPATPGTMQERATAEASKYRIYCSHCIKNGNCDRGGPHCASCREVCTDWDNDLAAALVAFAASEVAAATKQLREERDLAREQVAYWRDELSCVYSMRDALRAEVEQEREFKATALLRYGAMVEQYDAERKLNTALRADLATAVDLLKRSKRERVTTSVRLYASYTLTEDMTAFLARVKP
jgi:antirestriction protein